MKRLSPVYGSALVLLAVAGGLLYPFAPTDDYIANAKEYYETYKPDGILYQKVERYTVHPKGYDMDTRYTWETWDYEGNHLDRSTNATGELSEAMMSNSMIITDAYGNIYMYGDPKEFATNRVPVIEAPYCVQHLFTETDELERYSSEAFEASPSALSAFESFAADDRFYPFTHSGETGDLMYIGGGGYNIQKDAPEPEVYEGSEEQQLWDAVFMADSSPEQAELLFDLLSDGTEYTHEVKTDENGQELHVFRLPPVPYSIDEDGNPSSEAKSTQEFVFNGTYQLLEMNTYKDDKLVDQTRYLEEKVLPLSELESIFDPEAYGFELFTFEHPYEVVGPTAQNHFKEDVLKCYSFQNEPLSEEETAALSETYAPLLENIKALWKNDLPR